MAAHWVERRNEILTAVAAVLDGITEAEPAPDGLPADPLGPGVDLADAVRALTATAGEIAAQRRSQAALAETVAQQAAALEGLRDEVARSREERADRVREARTEATAPLLVAMLDVRDRLDRALADARRRRDAFERRLRPEPAGAGAAPDETGDGPSLAPLWRRLRGVFGRGDGALPAAPDAADGAAVMRALVRGLELTLERLDTMLDEQDVREYACAGRPFDPGRMQAAGAVIDPQAVEGTVLEVERSGYERGGRVLRTARVRVARRASPGARPEGAGGQGDRARRTEPVDGTWDDGGGPAEGGRE